MKKIEAHISFKITDIEMKSENFCHMKNEIFSGNMKRNFQPSKTGPQYKVGRDFIPLKMKLYLNIKHLENNLNQIDIVYKFNVSDIDIKSNEFIGFNQIFSTQELTNIFLKQDKEKLDFDETKHFKFKDLSTSITIK